MKPSTTTATDIMVSSGYPPSTNLMMSLTPSNMTVDQPGQLASVLAHEIRNPLSTIKLSAEMLKSMVTDNNQKIFLDMIIRGSLQINDILTDLHTSLRTTEAHSEKHSIQQLLDEVLAMAEDKIMLKRITVRKEYAAKDCKMVLNEQKMKIALTNIIINAIDAMPPENGELKLVTRLTDSGYVIQIEDNGCGISKENLKNIFKPYFTNKPNGLGLGLAKTHDILRSNHVGINVKSEEGRGTRFILLFEKRILIKPLHQLRRVSGL
jgi:signal transduction histidine kinase